MVSAWTKRSLGCEEFHSWPLPPASREHGGNVRHQRSAVALVRLIVAEQHRHAGHAFAADNPDFALTIPRVISDDQGKSFGEEIDMGNGGLGYPFLS